jgi:RHS repeat-associated protein
MWRMNSLPQISKTASRQKLPACGFAPRENRPERRAASRVWQRQRAKLASGKSLYNYFRDYDPSTGRYVQSDPIGLGGGLSTYLYANANSLTFIDPSGESAVVVAGACVVVGTTIYFVWKFGKFKKCVEQCVKCPNNPDRDPNVQCQPLKDDGKTNPNASCKTYCTLDAFGGPRGKGPAGSRDYP